MPGYRYVLPVMTAMIMSCSTANVRDNRTIEILDAREPVIGNTNKAASSGVVGGHKTAIRQYRDFLATQPEYPLKAEAMRRLIDLEAEGRATSSGNNKNSKQPMQSARLYEKLLAAYPQYPGNDLVLYQLARVYGDAGMQHKALDSLGRLVHEYPHTIYYTEAQFRRGELYFLIADYENAEKAYKAVVNRPGESFFHEKARYMYGWTLYKRQRYGQSIAVMRKLLDENITGDGNSNLAGKDDMVQDCLRVSGLAFMHSGGHSAIARYYNKAGRPVYEWRVYRSLGDIYLKKNRIRKAAAVFTGFSAAHPFHLRAPEFQLQAIDAFEKGGYTEQAIHEKTGFVSSYGIDSAYWKRASAENRSLLSKQVKLQLNELATFYHSRAQKKSGKAGNDYARAAQWYEKYLAWFADDENLGSMAYLLADSYYEMDRYEKAISVYERSAYEFSPHKNSLAAAYSALVTYEKLIKQSPASARETRRRQIESALRFAKNYPHDRRTVSVLVKVAEDYFAMGEMETARDMAIRVLEYKKPRAVKSERLTARTVLAHAWFELGQFKEAEDAYSSLLRSGGLRRAQKKQFSDRLASSIYKQGEQARDKKQHGKAAAYFIRAGKAAADSSIKAVAHYDAAASYAAARQWQKASRQLESFQRRYPDHRLQSEVTEKLAFIYNETGDARKASALYERIARTSKDPAVRRDATWKSAELSEKGGNHSKAIELYKKYVAQQGQAGESGIEARHKIAVLYGKKQNVARQRYWQQQLVAVENRLGRKQTERTRYLAAATSLELAEPDFRQYQKIRLVRPLKVNLRKKKAKMEIALSSYGKAADYGVAEVTTASTYKIAQIYQDFGEKLLNSQRPKGLSGLELEQYNVLLEEQAYPFEEKAIDTHEINAARVKEGIYNKWIKKSFTQLGRLRPARYGKQEMQQEVIVAIH